MFRRWFSHSKSSSSPKKLKLENFPSENTPNTLVLSTPPQILVRDYVSESVISSPHTTSPEPSPKEEPMHEKDKSPLRENENLTTIESVLRTSELISRRVQKESERIQDQIRQTSSETTHRVQFESDRIRHLLNQLSDKMNRPLIRPFCCYTE